MNNGDNDKDRENDSRQADENRRRKNEAGGGAQKIIALTGFGVRVEIIDKGLKEARCRRLQDGKELIIPVKELVFLPPSDPVADQPRELFQHITRWRDPAEIS
jgi:hypothetical protein